MTSFLFRALIYYHVKKNNASQLKQFLQNLRQSCSGRAQQTQKTRKITAYRMQTFKSRRIQSPIGAAKRAARVLWQIRACKSGRQSEISVQWDKNGLTYARSYVILQMEPPKERFRRAHNPKVGSTPNIAAPLFQIAPNNLQTLLNKTLIAFGGSIQKIFMRSPPRAEYAHRNSNVHGLKIL